MTTAPTTLSTATRPSDAVPTLALTVPAKPSEISGIRRAIGALGRRAGLDADGLADVALAVAEACANAVIHAYAGRDPGVLRVSAEVTHDGLLVVVADDGRGMASRPDSPGLGLGLPLMASLTTALEVRVSAAGGTEIRMAFPAPGPDAASAWAEAG